MRAVGLMVGCLVSMLVPQTSLAAVKLGQVPVGPRAIGLAGAFSAISDDASALFWNPAGLVQVGHQEFSASHADLFGTGVRDNFAAFVVPLSPGLAAATDWYHSGFDDGTLGFRENRVDLGFGLQLRPGLQAGFNTKLLTRSLDLDATSLGSSRGLGFDAGVLCSLADAWRVGLAAQDLFDTHLTATDGSSEVAYPRNVRLGAAWNWRGRGLVSAQLDDRWHLGLESAPISVLTIRAGAQRDLRDAEGTTWACGLGARAGILRVDWAREFPPTLASTDHFSAAFEFNFNPPLIRLERPRVDDLYASLQRSYAREPMGSVRVRNLQDRPIEAVVSVHIPEFMERPTERVEVLRPRAVTEVPLTAVLDERMLALRGDRNVQVTVTASYASRRLTRKERANGSAVAYAPGAIDWSRGMDQAAAFVTPRDPAVESLAREAARTVIEQHHDGFPNRNLSLMAAMVDAVATVGVTYVPDPLNPFASISQAPKAVDTIYYPSQTLARRTGDCDDTTVLLASLLASVGVPSRLVDAPGHIFLVAGTGVDERNANGLGVDSTRYVVLDHEVWIPIETTVSARGFLEAWRTGAGQLVSNSDSTRFVDVSAAQMRYEPVLPPGERAVITLDAAELSARLSREAEGLSAWRDEYFRDRFGGSSQELQASAETFADVARVHLDAGDLAGARAQLERGLERAPQSAMLHHDMGVVLVGLDSLESAEAQFRAALAFGGATALTWMDLGIVRWIRGDSVSAMTLLADGIRRAGGIEPLLDQVARSASSGGDAAKADPELRGLLVQAERTMSGAKVRPPGAGESVPRLPAIAPGARARAQGASARDWYPRLGWWQ